MTRTSKIIFAASALLIMSAAGAYVYLLRPTKPISPANAQPAKTDDRLAASASETIFHITPQKTRAEFSIYELLRGEPKTVIGETTLVEGDIIVDRAKLPSVRIGTIRINARGLKTDSPQRDRALSRFILKSEADENEYIEFKPKSVIGLPEAVKNGEAFAFEIIGDLTISGTKKEATFKGTVQFSSDTELTGSVEGVVRRTDYGLEIPNLPFIANVGDEVRLKIELRASSS